MRICILLLATLISLNSTFGQERKELAPISEKLKIVIPKFKQNAKIQDVLKSLKELSAKHDPKKKGLTIIYRPNPDKKDNEKTFNFDFENMPIGEIVRYICISSNLKFKVDKHAVIVADQNIQLEQMVTRFYPVRSKFMSIISDLKGDKKTRAYFESLGVNFSTGADVAYLEGVSRLVVTNTNNEQSKIQQILKALMADLPTVEAQLAMIRKKVDTLNEDIQLLEQLINEKKPNNNLKEIHDKLKLIIPKVRFEDQGLKLVIDFLQRTTKDLDPKNKGLNFIVKINKNVNPQNMVNLDADNMPVGEIIKYVCDQLNLKFKVEKFAIVISK